MADNWRIISQRQTTEISPTGTGFEDVWQVTYQVTAGPSRGTTAMITVPEEDHTADFLRAAINAKVSALDSVANL